LAPADLPVVPEHLLPQMRLVTRGAEQADAIERAKNPRSIPVRLRAAERIRDAA
jgi:16S rRNA (cytosine1402-N4)-methyltransferase